MPPPTVGCHHLLPTVYCLPSSVICPLPSFTCHLPTIYCPLSPSVTVPPFAHQHSYSQRGSNTLVTCCESATRPHLTTVNMLKSAKKRNTAKPQPQQQPQLPSSPSSVPVLPSPAATMNNGPQPPISTVPATDFAFFLQHATSKDLERFLELAATTQGGRNLRLLWCRAFTEGVEQGTDKAKFATDLQLLNANLDGFQDGYESGCDSVEEIIRQYEARIEKALYNEWSTWKGHSDACFELPLSPSTRDFAVQSDPFCLFPTTSSLTCEVATQSDPISFPLMASSSTQTPSTLPAFVDPASTFQNLSTPLPPLINQPTPQDFPPKKLSWADNVATSLPSFIPSVAPRDLSCLRSEKAHPFGALRQRDHRTHRQPRKSRNRNTFISSDPKSHSVPIPPISSFTISKKTHTRSVTPPYLSPSRLSLSPPLNWEDDPRLLALSHALRALGWNRGVS